MTDPYKAIREALAMGPTPGQEANAALAAACDPETIRALLKERDKLRTLLSAAVFSDIRNWPESLNDKWVSEAVEVLHPATQAYDEVERTLK